MGTGLSCCFPQCMMVPNYSLPRWNCKPNGTDGCAVYLGPLGSDADSDLRGPGSSVRAGDGALGLRHLGFPVGGGSSLPVGHVAFAHVCLSRWSLQQWSWASHKGSSEHSKGAHFKRGKRNRPVLSKARLRPCVVPPTPILFTQIG